jgi:hypothetical protein
LNDGLPIGTWIDAEDFSHLIEQGLQMGCMNTVAAAAGGLSALQILHKLTKTL